MNQFHMQLCLAKFSCIPCALRCKTLTCQFSRTPCPNCGFSLRRALHCTQEQMKMFSGPPVFDHTFFQEVALGSFYLHIVVNKTVALKSNLASPSFLHTKVQNVDFLSVLCTKKLGCYRGPSHLVWKVHKICNAYFMCLPVWDANFFTSSIV